MINLCLVVIATQFSETKKREMERMRQERARFTSSSTLASSTNNSEPTTCYAEIVKYIAHLYRRLKRRLIKKLRLYKYAFDNRLCCCFEYALDLLIRFNFIKQYTEKITTCWSSFQKQNKTLFKLLVRNLIRFRFKKVQWSLSL